MKYTVSIAIDARVDVSVEADSFEEAREKAKLSNVNLSTADIINKTPVNAEDENGTFKDY